VPGWIVVAGGIGCLSNWFRAALMVNSGPMQMLQLPDARAILAKLISQSQIPSRLFSQDPTSTTTKVLWFATTRAIPDHGVFVSQNQDHAVAQPQPSSASNASRFCNDCLLRHKTRISRHSECRVSLSFKQTHLALLGPRSLPQTQHSNLAYCSKYICGLSDPALSCMRLNWRMRCP
jgi:hypothetical protein